MALLDSFYNISIQNLIELMEVRHVYHIEIVNEAISFGLKKKDKLTEEGDKFSQIP